MEGTTFVLACLCMFCTQMPFQSHTNEQTDDVSSVSDFCMSDMIEICVYVIFMRGLNVRIRMCVFTRAIIRSQSPLMEPIPALYTTPSSSLDQ